MDTSEKYEELGHIEVERGQIPKGQTIIESVTGGKWVVMSAYNHLGEDFVKAIRVPHELKTFRIVER